MKFILFVLSLIIISACSSPPPAPKPSGEWHQINNASYYNGTTQ